MAKVKTKGTVIRQTISSVLTAVAQIIEFSHDGAVTETFDATCMDTSGAGREYAPTGLAEGGSFAFTIFYDPALAGHQAITDLITTPATCIWDIAFTSAVTQYAWTSAGVGFSFTGVLNDGLKADVDLKITGLLAYPT